MYYVILLIAHSPFFSFQVFIYFFERQSDRKGERERKESSKCWFTPQVLTTARAGSGGCQEPGLWLGPSLAAFRMHGSRELDRKQWDWILQTALWRASVSSKWLHPSASPSSSTLVSMSFQVWDDEVGYIGVRRGSGWRISPLISLLDPGMCL